MSDKIALFQFHGCTKCFNETIMLPEKYGITKIEDPKKWSASKLDIAIITGFLQPDDHAIIAKIGANSKKVIAFGSCATTAGIFGLATQKGIEFLPVKKEIPDVVEVHGCLGEHEELLAALEGRYPARKEKLCATCGRKSTCNYLDSVQRQVNLEELEGSCFNNVGYVCSGYIARDCKEQCVKAGAPCRGCNPMVDRPGIRFLGMFGTLMANVEVATEATGKGGTDKLADVDDDVTAALPDITGNFFRFNLATSTLPIGRNPSTGNLFGDILTVRLLEELPSILGMIGGKNSISLALDAIEAYEKGTNMEISEKVKELRSTLRNLEKDYHKAVDAKDKAGYSKVCEQIRKIAGNMNLSRLYFGGFRTAIPDHDDFDAYKSQVIEFQAGDYKQGLVAYTITNKGEITQISISYS